MRLPRRCVVPLILLALLPPGLAAQGRADSAMFVVRIGQDTSRYMWLVREGDRLNSVSANRIGGLHILRGEAVLDGRGRVEWLEQRRYAGLAPDTAAPVGGVRIRTTADSTVLQYGLTDDARTLAFAGRGQFINTSHYFEALATISEIAPAAVGDSVVGWHYAGTLFPQQRFVIRRTAPDALTAWSRPLGTIRVRLDGDGRVLEFDGAGTSALNFTGTRMPWRDIDATIRDMREQEAAGKRFGPLSPSDSLRATAAGAEIAVRYFRPYKRGRVIFGGIVPWDRVWRTGANRATAFETSRPIAFGDAVLPAGAYTMWTLPTESGWTLIFNEQTGQWGTEHDPARDVLRVPMATRALEETIEQLTILVDGDGERGVLRVVWDQLEASAEFTAGR